MILQFYTLARGRSGRFASQGAKCVLAALLGAGLAGCATAAAGPDANAPVPAALDARLNGGGAAALSPFQWALWDGAGLLFAPAEGRLYAARRNGDQVLEALPPKISVTFLHSDAERAVTLNSVLAPQEIVSSGWVLERLVNGRWTAVSDYDFAGDGFVLEGGEKISLSEFGSIRFSPRER